MTARSAPQQEGAVESFEGLGRVDGLPAGAGDVDVGAVDLGEVLDVVGDAGHQVPAIRTQVERHRGLGGLAVLRRDRADDLAGDVVHVLELARLLLHRSQVVGCEPGRLLVDHRGRDRVGVLERLHLLQGARRLRVAGQPRGGLVVLDLGELAREAAEDDDGDDPEEEHEPLGDAAGELAGDLTMHADYSIRWAPWGAIGFFPETDPGIDQNSSPGSGFSTLDPPCDRFVTRTRMV